MRGTSRFDRGLRRLTAMFVRHQDAPRAPERVVELAEARAALEDARSAMQQIRSAEGLRFPERESPDYVDPSIGLRPASRLGIVAALAGAIGLVVAFALPFVVFDTSSDPEVELIEATLTEELTPLADGSCRWSVAFEVQNNADVVLQLRTLRVTNQFGTDTRPGQAQLLPGDRAAGALAIEQASCPASPDAVDHGPLQVTYSYTTGGQWATIDLSF